MQRGRRVRSASEPVLRLRCSSVSRERRRESEVSYERGKDRAAHWISRWTSDEVCAVLYHLVARCSLAQLESLSTSLESVPHRDFQLCGGRLSGLELCPLSTPLSREVQVRLRKSRRPQNRHLYRAQSAVVHHESPLRHTPLPPSLCSAGGRAFSLDATRLPGLPPSPSPSPQVTHTLHSLSSPFPSSPNSPTPNYRSSRAGVRALSSSPSRVLSPPRRHMLTPPTANDLVTSLELLHNKRPVSAPPPPLHTVRDNGHTRLPVEATQLLTWFSSLTGWQQRETLQVVVMNLDPGELYYLAALLLSCQYRDFIACLPESLAVHILSLVPPKHLLRICCRVSRAWSKRCASEVLWRRLCLQTRLGLPMNGCLSWRQLFQDCLRMKRNWWRGQYSASTLQGHGGRVLCVQLRESVVATGSTDCTVRIWSLETGECVKVLSGHTKSVWCVCFYGKRLLLSGSSDHSVKVWNTETGACECTLEGHSGPVWGMQQRKEVLITGSQDKSVSSSFLSELSPFLFQPPMTSHRSRPFPPLPILTHILPHSQSSTLSILPRAFPS